MNMLNNYRQIVLIPWVLFNNSSIITRILRIVLFGIVIVAISFILTPESMDQKFSIVLLFSWIVVLCLFLFWGFQFYYMQRLNNPTNARIVPNHIRALRQVLVVEWLVFSIVIALLLGLNVELGSILIWAVGAAVFLLFLATAIRWNKLFYIIFFVLMFSNKLILNSAFQSIIHTLNNEYERHPVFLSFLSLAFMGWIVFKRLIQTGGATHITQYTRLKHNRQLAKQFGMSAATRRKNISFYWAESSYYTRAFKVERSLYIWWLYRLIENAMPCHKSALARAEMVYNANTHWTRLLTILVVYLFLFLLVAIIWGLFQGTAPNYLISEWRGNGFIGSFFLMIAIMGIIKCRWELYQTRREQVLLTLLPNMPQGSELNRMLTWNQIRYALITWLFSATVIWLQGEKLPIVINYVLCSSLLLLPFIVQDLSSFKSHTPVIIILITTLVLMISVSLIASLHHFLGYSLWTLFQMAGLLSAVILAWRWRKLFNYPQAFPVARLGD